MLTSIRAPFNGLFSLWNLFSYMSLSLSLSHTKLLDCHEHVNITSDTDLIEPNKKSPRRKIHRLPCEHRAMRWDICRSHVLMIDTFGIPWNISIEFGTCWVLKFFRDKPCSKHCFPLFVSFGSVRQFCFIIATLPTLPINDRPLPMVNLLQTTTSGFGNIYGTVNRINHSQKNRNGKLFFSSK